jgi:hypothetical protein
MIDAPRCCSRAWLSLAQEFDISYRPLQARHLVTFDSNRAPHPDRVAFRRQRVARRTSPVP